ncbi:MAG TPA: nuclear transport factor 2 family protein [Caulobacteraceae bacterium]|jgi:hypothetical protein|nr:nuclear transport factor 2 family protein [Caulobacteraceae bacterium]
MSTTLSRRKLFKAGGGVLAGAALVSTAAGAQAADQGAVNEALVRVWYGLWASQRDWAPYDAMLADDFAFSSTNGEDHIGKAEFKANCWAPNVNLTKSLDIELIMSKGDEVVVKYLGRTTSGKGFRNVELLRVRGGRIESIECYFGGKSTFPAAVEAQKT